ncbi:23S rRNA (uracil(1939)-C(5))-methyltransferase RlmD [Salinisphaera sp. Q1T1-3]|uniref:23S rRNA (uracil(1939)-C(5))-methyltransferase RlmD n=1 Tax=Salinisphaera sp. Q1T1-3 TaxID=2321229 RepID=UPI000E745815|nr:23S rRNA (uracil(1939)-C(5))-methyltransferase RlmD [Salinisphaera sp. Q1T1-3]RJS92044.1 23S rRNA (uracil(1939)-C(5))-methyltransferase RlmD [Salinisphaera sp. Q1T1-3]
MSRKARKRARRHAFGVTEITDLASNARGVGHVDGKAVFVADTLPGEQVLFQPVKVRRDYEEADMVTLFSAATNRVTPECAHFGLCGGCALQHASPDAQLRFKQGQLVSALSRVGHVQAERELAPLVGARWGYRRRARLGVKYVPKKGGTLVGFRERGKPFIAELSRCEVLVPSVGTRLRDLAHMIDRLTIRERIPQIEVAAADNRVALVFRVLDEPSAADREVLAAFGTEYDFAIYLQPGNERTIAPLEGTAEPLYYTLPDFDARLYFLPNDFVQIHAGVNEAMVAAAIGHLDLQIEDTVLELFAGLGNFSVPLARSAGRVVTVEGEDGLVERARDNARANDCANIEAHVDNLFEPAAAPAWMPERVDKVLIDPPRSGAAEVMPLIAASGASRIVYCSCHPATLARDADTLVNQHGYRLVAAGVMDMFPHTAHIESMAVFER